MRRWPWLVLLAIPFWGAVGWSNVQVWKLLRAREYRTAPVVLPESARADRTGPCFRDGAVVVCPEIFTGEDMVYRVRSVRAWREDELRRGPRPRMDRLGDFPGPRSQHSYGLYDMPVRNRW